MRYLFIVSTLFFLGACSTNKPTVDDPIETNTGRPQNASDYKRQLIYPRETENFVFDSIVEFDDPFYGAALRYIDNRDYPDAITIIIYPIAATLWSNQELALNSEVENFVTELDNTVIGGGYKSRSPETKEDFIVSKDGNTLSGKKVHFEFTTQQDIAFNADAYFFIQKDKYIKIRTSSPKAFTPNWNGDLITQELLPEFIVPDESEYMKNLREEYRRQAQQNN